MRPSPLAFICAAAAALSLLIMCMPVATTAFLVPANRLAPLPSRLSVSQTLARSNLPLLSTNQGDDAPKTPKPRAPSPPPPPQLSSSMRAKLLREAQSQGADPNANAGNPIAVIGLIIAVLVILGGKGFFF